MKRKLSILIIAMATVSLLGFASTLAWLIAASMPVINTFTIGRVEITLTETSGDTYQMIPGISVFKDPRVTVKAGSEACWLFVKVEESADFNTFMSYAVVEGWSALDGQEGVYYREVTAAASDIEYTVLLNDTVTIKETVTERQLTELSVYPTLTFSAYAVQHEGVSSATLAWQEIESSS